MAYTVLARRYRSTTFDEVVGQSHIAQTLKKAIETGRIAHAYLFCGTRGTGKTSTARIFAKCLNCQSADHSVTVPCGKCDSCQGIARGDDIDVIEIDAASNTGVDDVREIIENSQYRPARSRFKVYIIDEVHMLSKNAFNALLKTLEEPPSHVKFILATTEPEKVLPTILSRCQRYDFRNIPTREIAGHLAEICKTEKLEADPDALLLVAKAGAGSMRDALSLLDRLLSVGHDRLTTDAIEQLLGLPKSQLLFDLAEAIGEGRVADALTQTDAMISAGLSVDALVASVTDHLRNLLLLATCGAESKLVEVPGLPLADLVRQAGRFDPGALSQDIVILEELRRHLRQSQAGRALLDATLVRMALADQFSSISDLIGSAQKKKSDVSGPAPSPGPPGQGRGEGDVERRTTHDPRSRPHPTPLPEYPEREQEARPAAETYTDDNDALPAVGKVFEGDRPSLSTLMARQKAKEALAAPAPVVPAREPANIQPVREGDLPGQWQAVLALLAPQGPGLGGILAHGRYAGIKDGQAVIQYTPENATFVKMLDRNGKKDVVRDAFSKVLERAIGVRFEIDAGAAAAAIAIPDSVPMTAKVEVPPAAPVARPEQAAVPAARVTDEMRTKIYQDNPLVKAVMDQFGGAIIKVE